MRKINLILALLFGISLLNSAQAPNMFNYQASIRDGAGLLLSSQEISMRVSLLQGSTHGTQVYTEKHNVTTSEHGIINIIIGTGNSSDNFESIGWKDGPFFLKVEIDLQGGVNFTELGITQLLSVPYALYAEQAGTVAETNWKRSGNNLYYNDGKIGIGTDTPASLLNINSNIGTGDERDVFQLNNSNDGSLAFTGIKLKTGTSLGYFSAVQDFGPNYNGGIYNNFGGFLRLYNNNNGVVIYTDSENGIVKFCTGSEIMSGEGEERMRIDAKGNIGIGTESPSSLLNLFGNIESGTERNMFQLQNINESSAAYTGIKLKTGFSDGQSVIQDYGMTYTVSTYYDFAGFLNLSNSNRGVMLHANSAEGVIKFYTGHDDTMGAGLERLRIDATGNIGIGTASVKSKLQIADGEIYISDINKGIIMTSPDGKCWRGTINNSGVLEFVAIDCP
jgi:hypothetical protein